MESVSALEDALEAAFAQYEMEGERALRARFDIGSPRFVTVRDGRRYDAEILGELVLSQTSARVAEVATSGAALVAAAGTAVVSVETWTVEDELAWRLSAWEVMRARVVDAGWLRERGIYGGMQGVWVDVARTRALAPEGAAVAVRHTGRHYADDIDEHMAIYHYPRTARPASRDRNEIEAVKNAAELHLPIFVIGEAPGGARPVRLAWVIAADDEAEVFLLEFADSEPRHLDMREPTEPFQLTKARRRSTVTQERYTRSTEFTFRVLARHHGRCAVTGVGVPEVLDAAHVVPIHRGGTDDERNGLLLTATLHRAYDTHLWSIEPRTLELRSRNQDRALANLHVQATTLRSDVRPPHRDALEWRWRRFLKAGDTAALDAAVHQI